MTDEYRAERVLGVPRATEFPSQHGTPQRRGYQAYAAKHPEPPLQHSIHDVALLLGLDAETLSPVVVAAVMPLLAEIDRLRGQAEQNERRCAYLEHAADHHSVVPCLNRRAFLRELDGVLQSGEEVGTVAVLHIGGVERLCQIHGMAAGEGALRHAAAAIIGAIRASDLLGCLVGSDFGLLLLGTNGLAADDKLEEICGRIKAPPYRWADQPVVLTCLFGLAVPEPGQTAEQVVAVADRARCGVEPAPEPLSTVY